LALNEKTNLNICDVSIVITEMTQIKKMKQETKQETRQTHDQDTSYHALTVNDYTGDYDVSDIETNPTHPSRIKCSLCSVSCVLFIGLLYFLVMVMMIVNDAYQRILREDDRQAGSGT
tara:strand:- start:117 stop:470 length:354 start_codon:yes stop_codon:yes gene_type:complete